MINDPLRRFTRTNLPVAPGGVTGQPPKAVLPIAPGQGGGVAQPTGGTGSVTLSKPNPNLMDKPLSPRPRGGPVL